MKIEESKVKLKHSELERQISGRKVMRVVERVAALRQRMADHKIDAWIVPSADPHSSEYQSPYWQTREWVSGFTGSAGTAVILKESAGLWADGRYHIQAAVQLKDSGIDLYKWGLPEVPSYVDWLADNLPENSIVGFDGRVISSSAAKEMEKKFAGKNISFKADVDLFEGVWSDRPLLPTEKVIEHDVKFAGKSREEKLTEIREYMSEKGADVFLLSSLDDIAWLYNIRGFDVPNCPLVLSYTIIYNSSAYLCVDQSKVSSELSVKLESDGITLRDYEDIFALTREIPEDSKVLLHSKIVNSVLEELIPESCTQIDEVNITTRMKAVKNDVEVAHFKNCLIRDGAYVVQFMKWLEDTVGKEKITEKDAEQYLYSLRASDPEFHGVSFTTIPGYRANGALMHYRCTEDTNQELKEGSFFLVDSGGLYSDGTTDITRTFSYGDLTAREIRDFTLVLQGHINLSQAKFLHGTRGVQLDILARHPQWKEGINYGCGTGHGVGFFLNVHEGPHNISPGFLDEKIIPGMVVTNEPGIYREGEYGIRIENIMLCVAKEKTEFGKFYEFEAITMCPIETRSIDKSLLSENEIEWLNNYHEQVFNSISPLLDAEHVEYLKEKTKAI
jgi:Xaa-Pro aminopeptidase